MNSLFKMLSATALVLVLTIQTSHANMVKAGVATAAEIFAYMKNAVVNGAKTIKITPFGFGRSAEARMIYMIAKGNSGEIFMTVSRNPGPSMTQMNIELVQKLSPSSQKAVSQMPGSYRMNEDVTDAVRAALNATEVNNIGQRVLKSLENLDGLAVRQDSLGTLAYRLEQMQMELGSMTLGKGNSAIHLVDDLGGTGSAASFRIEIGLSKNTTPEEVQAILNAIEGAI